MAQRQGDRTDIECEFWRKGRVQEFGYRDAIASENAILPKNGYLYLYFSFRIKQEPKRRQKHSSRGESNKST